MLLEIIPLAASELSGVQIVTFVFNNLHPQNALCSR